MFINLNKLEYCPKVSIVIPAYNASNYLSKAINCALEQTYTNLEVIVVNDGSKDDGKTADIARSYGDRIVYIEKENGGSSSALNVGIKAMTGEWFSWLSHDDLYYPNKVEKQVEFLNKLSKLDDIIKYVLFCACENIDENGNVIRNCNHKEVKEIASFVNNLTDNAHLIAEPTKYMFYGCGCLIHKDVFKKLGGFNEKLKLVNDIDMWFRIYSAGFRIRFIEDVLVQGRIHSEQVSRSIGFSYHNPEQDMYWSRSLDWLKEHNKDDYSLFVKYGCNAYKKTRNNEAKLAFEYAKKLKPQSALQLSIKKSYCICYATLRNFIKKIYIKLKIG